MVKMYDDRGKKKLVAPGRKAPAGIYKPKPVGPKKPGKPGDGRRVGRPVPPKKVR